MAPLISETGNTVKSTDSLRDLMPDISIRSALVRIRAEIATAAERAGRNPSKVGLVAVTKGVGPDRVRQAYEAGMRYLGESRVQEAIAKMASLEDLRPEWHFIGHLQTNKVSQAVGRFSLIHSVDSNRLLKAIHERAITLGIRQRLLLQVNVAREAAKQGFAPEALPGALQQARGLAGVAVEGLMTIAPQEPDAARRAFRDLRALRDDLAPDLETLSMGMTGDYEIAVEEGATLVRIGTGLFGSRIQGQEEG